MIYLVIYLVLCITIYIILHKKFLSEIDEQLNDYINTSEYTFLLMCLTFPITFIMILIDLIKQFKR